jgi:hypothetical protein
MKGSGGELLIIFILAFLEGVRVARKMIGKKHALTPLTKFEFCFFKNHFWNLENGSCQSVSPDSSPEAPPIAKSTISALPVSLLSLGSRCEEAETDEAELTSVPSGCDGGKLLDGMSSTEMISGDDDGELPPARTSMLPFMPKSVFAVSTPRRKSNFWLLEGPSCQEGIEGALTVGGGGNCRLLKSKAFNEAISDLSSFISDFFSSLLRIAVNVSFKFCTAVATSPTNRVRFVFISLTVSSSVFFGLVPNNQGPMNLL